MKKEEEKKKSDLIPLLIEYKKVIGELFPIERVKHLSNEVLIKRIKQCIKNKKRYDIQIFKLDNCQILNDEELKQIISLIIKTLDSVNYDYKEIIEEILKPIVEREKGRKFDFKDHLYALVLTMLCNNRWGDTNIKNNINRIKAIFHDFDKNYLKLANSTYLVEELKKIHCTNLMINKQMKVLPYNIKMLEKIESDYDSLDEFVSIEDSNKIANLLYDGKYKMKQVGKSFAFDYLKKVGINCCKSSTQMERLFGMSRLGIVTNEVATAGQVISIIKKLAKLNNLKEIEVELLLQQFCLSKFSNICSETPRCNKCFLREICNYNK